MHSPSPRDPATYEVLELECPHGSAPAWCARLEQLGCTAIEQRDQSGRTLLVAYPSGEQDPRYWLRELEALGEQSLRMTLRSLDGSWRTRWTESLAPIQLTETLLLFPHPPPRPPEPGELFLAPAFAFGFGEHPTTRLAAQWLAGVLQAIPRASVLDLGSGTGVLTLVAARLGARTVVGLDTSPDAVDAARHNAHLNGLASRCSFHLGDISTTNQDFDVIVANIEAAILIDISPRLASRVGHACVGLTGFQRDQIDPLTTCYAARGIDLVPAIAKQEWILLERARVPR